MFKSMDEAGPGREVTIAILRANTLSLKYVPTKELIVYIVQQAATHFPELDPENAPFVQVTVAWKWISRTTFELQVNELYSLFSFLFFALHCDIRFARTRIHRAGHLLAGEWMQLSIRNVESAANRVPRK